MTLRNYFCPKCGAVADVTYYEAHTPEELADFQADYQRDRAAFEERKAKVAPRERLWMWQPFVGWERGERLTRGIQYGEHLAATCPRCTHRWVEPILAATEPTPVYDSIAHLISGYS